MPLKSQSVLLNILLSLLSLGIYPPIWYLRRLRNFRRLAPQLPAWPLWAALGIALADAGLSLAEFFGGEPFFGLHQLATQLLLQLVSVAGMVLLTISCFRLRRVLERAYDIRLDPALLLLFNIWYLQHWINHLVRLPQASAHPGTQSGADTGASEGTT